MIYIFYLYFLLLYIQLKIWCGEASRQIRTWYENEANGEGNFYMLHKNIFLNEFSGKRYLSRRVIRQVSWRPWPQKCVNAFSLCQRLFYQAPISQRSQRVKQIAASRTRPQILTHCLKLVKSKNSAEMARLVVKLFTFMLFALMMAYNINEASAGVIKVIRLPNIPRPQSVDFQEWKF